MEIKTFKKIVNDLLMAKGLKRNGNYYYHDRKDLLIIIGFQKSNFSKGYYINVSYIISEINPNLSNPKDRHGDVRLRFTIKRHEQISDFFDLDSILEDDQGEIQRAVRFNMENYIDPVTSLDELKALLKCKPVLLYQTKLTAKEFLGFQ